MTLFIIIIAILFVQAWGAQNPFHKDAWFDRWLGALSKGANIPPQARFLLAVGAPLLILGVFAWLLSQLSQWLLLPFGVVLLLYSFGRGEFSELLKQYTQACSDDDWSQAQARAEHIGMAAQDVAEGDWSALHLHMLNEAAYRGFERMFAVLFWFLVLGPLGALAYRLLHLYCERESANYLANKVLWGAEWFPVRILGLSFAFTGNFVGCMQHWRESVFCFARSTRETVGRSVLGALSVDDDLIQTCDVTRRELNLMDGLYRRTLWFWLTAVALFTLMN